LGRQKLQGLKETRNHEERRQSKISGQNKVVSNIAHRGIHIQRSITLSNASGFRKAHLAAALAALEAGDTSATAVLN
jgi:hypothetical protein